MTTEHAPQAPDTSPWETLGTTTIIQALMSMAALISPVLTPLIAWQLGGSASLLAGTLAGLTYLGAAIFSVVGGPFIYRWGAIRVSQVGMAVCAAGLAVGSTGSYAALLVCAFLVGVGNGPLTPASSHILARTTPAHRLSLVFSIKQTGVPLGGLAAGAIGPAVGLWLGWQAMLLALGIACMVFALAAQRLQRRLDTDARRDAPIRLAAVFEPARLVLGHPVLLRLALCSMAFTLAQLSVAAYSVTYFNEALGLGLVAAGLLLSVAQVGGIAGRIAWGYVADTWLGGRATLVVLGSLMACCTLGMALVGSATPQWLLAGLVALLGASAIGWNGVYLAQIARSSPAGAEGKATGGALMFSFTGNVIGPLALAAVIQASGGMRAAYALLAIPVGLAALTLFFTRMPPRSG